MANLPILPLLSSAAVPILAAAAPTALAVAPLPPEMQGRWVAVDNPSEQLVVNGGEIICFGRRVNYDYKEIERKDGALTVSLKVNEAAREDSFQRENITELVISPEGKFFAYNVKFASEFVRARGMAKPQTSRGARKD